MTRGKRVRRRFSRRTHQNTVHRQQTGSRAAARAQQTSPPRRSYVQALVCGILFIALIVLKLVMPGNLSSLRGTLGQWLVRDADFAEAFSAVGRAVSGENGVADSISDAYIAVFGSGKEESKEVSGELIGAELPAENVSDLLEAQDLPESAAGEQPTLSFDYAIPISGTETSPFGWREHPVTGKEAFHYGVDLAADEGTDICCFADGTVGVVGDSVELGKYLTVNHADGFSTLYGHCSAVTVSSGTTVRKGQAIARVGSTGNATGPHLHFEVHDGEEYLDPDCYLVS